jgi:translation initiation factor 1A
MPNKTGGKNYKKMKHDSGDLYEAFVVREAGQEYGRVLRKLGGCNMLVYCNDGRERVCHIRGAMRKKTWISEGDLVLVCYRECTSGSDRGDIIHKYSKGHYGQIRKDKKFNQKLLDFDADKTGGAEEEGGFIFEEAVTGRDGPCPSLVRGRGAGGDAEGDASGGAEGDAGGDAEGELDRVAREKAGEEVWADKDLIEGGGKEEEDDEVDIDNI